MSLWGEPLAKELARGLAGTRVVPLSAIEPDLDPNVHHTNLPYAIISDRHTIAIVEGQSIAIDGPQQTNNSSRYAKEPHEIEANRAAIAEAAVWGVTAPAEQGGLVDTALSIMRFLKQRGAWRVYVRGSGDGMEGHIAARGGKYRWPAAVHLQTVKRGIRLTCGDSVRDIQSLTELADFAAREGTILDAQVLWCTQHVAMLEKLGVFGKALRDAFARGVPERGWRLYVGDEYFTLDAKTCVVIHSGEETQGTPAVLEPDGDGVKITIGAYAKTFATSLDIVARCEELVAAVKVWLTTPDAEPPVRDLSYYR